MTPVLALAAADADPVRSAAVSLAAAGCAVTAAALNGSPRRTLWTPARVVTHAAAGTLGVAAAVIAVIATFEEPLAGAGGAAAVIAVAAAAVFRPSFAARSRDKHDRQAGRRRRRCDQRGDWRCGPPGPHPGERSVGSQVSSRWTPDGVGVLTFAGAVAAVADRAQVTGLCVAAGVSAIVAVAVALTRGS